MFYRKKIEIEVMKERLNELEKKGYSKLNSIELHELVFHGYKEPRKLFTYFSWITVSVFLVFLIMSLSRI